MVTAVVSSPAPAPQGHCSQCGKVWTLKERQGVCQWCGHLAVCQSSRTKPRHIKSSRMRKQRQADGNGHNGYDHLDGEWLTYYKVASQFSHKAKAQDREDLLHDIIMTLANVERNNGHKRLKVVCGANTSYLDDLAWIGDKTPMTIADVRVSPSNTVKPNMGATELAEALTRVLPFTAKDDNRPVLSCVNFEAGEGKLIMVSADGFRLAVTSLDYDDGEGQALINRDDLKGIINALKPPIVRP